MDHLYQATVIIPLSAMEEILKSRNVGRALAEAIEQKHQLPTTASVPFNTSADRNASRAGMVIETHHEKKNVLIACHGNTGHIIEDVSQVNNIPAGNHEGRQAAVVIHMGALHTIRHDKEFGRQIFNAIVEKSKHSLDNNSILEFESTGKRFTEAVGAVVAVHPAKSTVVIKAGGNTGKVVAQP